MRTLEALEARALLASTFTFTDVDGDRVTVKVTGSGTAAVTLSNGVDGLMELIQLTGTDAQSALAISVKKQGGDGRVELHQMNNSVLGKLTAPTTDIFEADFSLDDITLFKIGDIDHASIDLTPPTGKPLSVEAAQIRNNSDLQFNGAIKSFKLTSSTGADFMTITGRLESLVSKAGLSGFWEAANYGNVTSGDVLSAKLRAVGPDAKGYSFGSIKAPNAISAEVEPTGAGAPGRIKSITVANWDGGEIHGTGIDTLKVSGNFAPNILDLSTTPLDDFSMGKVTITGIADTTFRLAGLVGSVKIGTAGAGLFFDAVTSQVHVGSLAFTGNGQVQGTFEFATLGKLTTGTSTGGTWSFSDLNGDGLSIGSMKVAALVDFNLLDTTPGGIGSLTTTTIEVCDIHCAFINTLTVKKGAAGGEGQGTLLDSDIFLQGSNGAGFSLGTATIGGLFAGARIQTAGNVDRFTVNAMVNATLAVGNLGSPAFDSFAGFDPAGRLNRFTVTGKFIAVDPAFNRSFVQAGTIASITVASAIDLDNLGTLYGFGAQHFGTINLKDPTGKTIKPAAPTVPGDTNPFLPTDSDFVFRVYA